MPLPMLPIFVSREQYVIDHIDQFMLQHDAVFTVIAQAMEWPLQKEALWMLEPLIRILYSGGC